MVNWREYLCDFLEMINIPQLRHYEATIKRGHYGLVDVNAKLEILSELVNRALETAVFREKLDELIEQRQALGASNREKALEDGRKRREEKERLKADSESNGTTDGHNLNSANVLTNKNHTMQNGDVGKKRNGEVESPRQDNSLGRRLDFIKGAVYACLYTHALHSFVWWLLHFTFLLLKFNLQWDQAIKPCFKKDI